MGVGQLHGADQVFSEHLGETRQRRGYSSETSAAFFSLPFLSVPSPDLMSDADDPPPRGQELTSAGFFGLEADVPVLPPFLLEEQKEVDGPERGERTYERGEKRSGTGKSPLQKHSLSLSELSLLLEDLSRFILEHPGVTSGETQKQSDKSAFAKKRGQRFCSFLELPSSSYCEEDGREAKQTDGRCCR